MTTAEKKQIHLYKPLSINLLLSGWPLLFPDTLYLVQFFHQSNQNTKRRVKYKRKERESRAIERNKSRRSWYDYYD